jgi:hypothetical protein
MITIFKDIKDVQSPNYITAAQALQRIESGKSRSTIELIRNGDKSKKSLLPVVCWSGEFKERKDDALKEHSGLIVLDFDKVNTEEVKNALSLDEYVYACWISPSGDGIKALVKISHPEKHRDHFRALTSYFSNTYALELDPTGINESRACYESYDEDIIIKESSKQFSMFISEQAEKQTVSNKFEGYTDYMKLNLAARMIRSAKDGEKHAALLKAARLCGGLINAGRMEEEEAKRVLIREILKKNIDSEESAIRTIVDGIELGKKDPIRDVISNEKSANRELMINDGDMSFISSDDEDYKWINDYAEGNINIGLTTGDAALDKYFRYKREFLIINGHSNVGKTTVALAMMVNASVRHGWKWIVYSSENRTASVKLKLLQFAFNKEVSAMDYAQRKAAYKWVNDHFIVISNDSVYSYSDIILFIEKVLKQQNVDGVFVDPYNSLKISMTQSALSTHDYHYEAASEFLTLSKSHDIAVWLNMHAVTEAQRRKGDDGLPTAPFAEDTEGGGKFVNRADCFVTVHRKVQAPDPEIKKTSEWHVRKVRETETGGEPTPLDEPVEFLMNVSGTGFRLKHNGNAMFDGVGSNFQNYSKFNMPSNVGFLNKKP